MTCLLQAQSQSQGGHALLQGRQGKDVRGIQGYPTSICCPQDNESPSLDTGVLYPTPNYFQHQPLS